MKYDVIIYDWNGTIIDDLEVCHSILCTLLREYGLPTVSLDEYRAAFTFPVSEYYKRVGFDLEKYNFDDIAVKYMPMYNKMYPSCGLHNGAIELVKILRKKGVKQYILSATEQDNLLLQTDYFGISGLFDGIIGTGNIHGKSKIAEGTALIKNINADKKRCLLVGDTHYDYAVANSLGISAALVDFGHKPRQELLKYTDKVFGNYSELSGYIID